MRVVGGMELTGRVVVGGRRHRVTMVCERAVLEAAYDARIRLRAVGVSEEGAETIVLAGRQTLRRPPRMTAIYCSDVVDGDVVALTRSSGSRAHGSRSRPACPWASHRFGGRSSSTTWTRRPGGGSCAGPVDAATCENPGMAATSTDPRLAAKRPAFARLRDPRSSRLSALAVSVLLVAASTLLVGALTPRVPVRSAGVFYLLAVLGASSVFGLWWGLATSLASALAFNFFFLPPEHTLVVNSSSDWLALAAFAVTAVVTSDLAGRERAGREEAARRAEEAGLGERLATVIATAPNLDDALAGLGDQAARTLGAKTGVIVRGVSPSRGPGVLPLDLNGRPIGELRLSGGDPALAESPAAGRVARQLAGLIALGEERERRMREEVNARALQRSDELKTALLRAVSHDLRSPLQAISAAAGGLHFAALDDEEQELLHTIGAESGRMSRMIENLLDLSRLTAGALPRAADWLDPRELVEAAVAELVRDGPQERVSIRLAPDVPLVHGDGPQLQRVLVNVIENALKFSSRDDPVGVRVERRGEFVDVAVSDRGPGVSADDADRIFEPFARGSRTGEVPGSGLGLAIARGLTRANGGELRLAPADGDGGATFVLTLPAAGSGPGP
jgi:two-component system sensor histidine kinase KdpD